jgi:hypothetical protein
MSIEPSRMPRKLVALDETCMKCGNYVELSEAKVITRAQTVRNVIYIVKELKLPEELRGKIPHRGV